MNKLTSLLYKRLFNIIYYANDVTQQHYYDNVNYPPNFLIQSIPAKLLNLIYTYVDIGSLTSINNCICINESGCEDYRYTGKHEDPSGLYYFGARYYDPDVGRFITRDTVFGNLTNRRFSEGL